MSDTEIEKTETEKMAEAEAALGALLDQLRPRHGALNGFYVEGLGAAVFRKGGHADWKRSKGARMQLLTNPEAVAMANANLARSLLVHPDPAAWDAFAQSEPGAADEIGAELFNRLDGGARVLLGKATS